MILLFMLLSFIRFVWYLIKCNTITFGGFIWLSLQLNPVPSGDNVVLTILFLLMMNYPFTTLYMERGDWLSVIKLFKFLKRKCVAKSN